jgi:4a-hydroxytetrahydrobiopterin dehydratase
MELAYRKLNDEEISTALTNLNGWESKEGLLTKTFEFKTYKDGALFASAVAYVADHLNHHPDLILSYGKVVVAMNTHDVAGLSPYDFELATRIERLI